VRIIPTLVSAALGAQRKAVAVKGLGFYDAIPDPIVMPEAVVFSFGGAGRRRFSLRPFGLPDCPGFQRVGSLISVMCGTCSAARCGC
jgi:hypothetical protein